MFIEGKIQAREWENRQGQKQTSFEIVAHELRMLGGNGENGHSKATETVPTTQPVIQDEDIPF